MCGISGIIVRKKIHDLDLEHYIKKMNQALSHRGPDNNQFIKVSSYMILGHTRLKIQDLSDNANQPIVSKKKNILCFNGEIYNHKELEPHLKRRTSSDTESLILSLEENENIIQNLDGMYSFAFWNQSEKKLKLHRDPVGIKPLYYYLDDNFLIFASEIKAILECDFLNFEVNDQSVKEYFTYGYVLSPKTGFQNIYQLQAGELFEFQDNVVQKSIVKKNKYFSESTFQTVFHHSIKKRLMADIPITSLLSGGVDSSAIAVGLKEISSEIKHTSIDFENKNYSEIYKLKWIYEDEEKQVSIVKAAEIDLERLEKVIYYADDLICDPALISNYLLFESVSNDYHVCLSGDGADELFLGYHTHIATLLSKSKMMRLIGSFLGLFVPIIKLFESKDTKYKLSEKIKRFNKFSKFEFPLNHMLWRAPIDKFIDEIKFDCKVDSLSDNIYNAMTKLDLKTYLEGNILKKVDRMSMAHSVECRVPYLDEELIDFAQKISPKEKIRRLKQKIILKKYLKNKVNKKLVNQKKQGFGFDLDSIVYQDWFQKNLFKESKSNIFSQYISKEDIQKALSEKNSYGLFSIFYFKKWLETFT